MKKKVGKYSGEFIYLIYYLSDDERLKFEIKFINGDVEVVFWLYKYYLFFNYDVDE